MIVVCRCASRGSALFRGLFVDGAPESADGLKITECSKVSNFFLFSLIVLVHEWTCYQISVVFSLLLWFDLYW